MTTPYDVLGVGKGASQSEIKRAYRLRSRTAHPDREGGSHEQMTAINRAYASLSDESKRAHYDQTGEEQVTPLEENAKANLAALVGELLEHYAAQAEFNLVEKIRLVIKSKQAEFETNVTAQRRKADKIERVLKKHLKPNKNANRMLVYVIEHQLKQTKAKVTELEQHQEIGRLMLNMIDGYGWEDGTKSPIPSPWGESMFVFKTGYTGT